MAYGMQHCSFSNQIISGFLKQGCLSYVVSRRANPVALTRPAEEHRNPAEDPVTAFEKLAFEIPIAAELVGKPDQLTRAIHRAWKDAGKTLKGKPRHSDRFLADQLKKHGAEVRSLTPKLAGGTRLRAEDASTLVHFCLSNWPRRTDPDEPNIEYGPLLQNDDITEIASSISSQIGQLGIAPAAPVIPLATSAKHFPGEDIGELLRRYHAQCDALFTVGTERPLVTQQPRTELLGFRNLMNLFRQTESDSKPRPLAWILDIGRGVFDERDIESRMRYIGVHALVTRFKALYSFDDVGRKERWEWLKSRAFFMVLDTKFEQPPLPADLPRANFLPHHLSFSALPPAWAMNSNYRNLYGSELERLDQRSSSVFFNAEGWRLESGERVNRRYFSYAQLAPDPRKPDETVGRGLELPSPGASYEAAYSTAYVATVTHLGLENRTPEAGVTGKVALAQLRGLGFRLMGLEEFMSL
jgi:hypothetical protein